MSINKVEGPIAPLGAARLATSEANTGSQPPQATTAPDALSVSAAAKPQPLKAQPSDPFASVATYKGAVDTAEGNIRAARANLSAAEQGRTKVDAETQRKLDLASQAQQARYADAIQPLSAAKADQETTRQKLQAPIDQTQRTLDQGRWDLEIATHPNKVELDQAREDGHAEVQRREATLGQKQQAVADVDQQLQGAQGDLAQNQAGLRDTEDRIDASSQRLSATQHDLDQAKYYAPSRYDLDHAARRNQEADQNFQTAQHRVDSAAGQVRARQHDLDHLLDENTPSAPPTGGRPVPPPVHSGGGDRPVPASTSTRPTPPSADRPTPPAVDRPVPPAVAAHSPAEIEQARTVLAQAQRSLDSANVQLDAARRELSNARGSYDDIQARWDRVNQLNQAVQSLQGEIQGLEGNSAQYQNNLQALQATIATVSQTRDLVYADRDQASRERDAARDASQRLDDKPYDQGNPAKIAKAQGRVDDLEGTLKRYQLAYTDGMKPPTDRVAQAQGTFDQTMAPYDQAVAAAQQDRQGGLTAASRTVDGAKGDLDRSQNDYNHLRNEVPTTKKIKWKLPGWLGGSGFDVGKFWKDRPAI